VKITVSFIAAGLFAATAAGQLSSGPGGSVYKPPNMPNVVAIPDITGDGIEDLLVGYPASYNAEGAIYVFAGPVSLSRGICHIRIQRLK